MRAKNLKFSHKKPMYEEEETSTMRQNHQDQKNVEQGTGKASRSKSVAKKSKKDKKKKHKRSKSRNKKREKSKKPKKQKKDPALPKDPH